MLKGKYSPSNIEWERCLLGDHSTTNGVCILIARIYVGESLKYFAGFTSDEKGEWKSKE